MKEPVVVRIDETSKEELTKLDAYLPTDTHLVRYIKDGKEVISAVSAYRRVDIFDEFHDRGFQVLEITNGFGRIKPNLYNPTALNEARI